MKSQPIRRKEIQARLVPDWEEVSLYAARNSLSLEQARLRLIRKKAIGELETNQTVSELRSILSFLLREQVI